MKITIHTDSSITDTEISIICNQMTPQIEKMISMLRMLDMQLTGIRDGELYILDISKVLYIDAVDKKIFLYTKDDFYETNLRLYELEEQLMQAGFFRANKSCIINFRHIVSLKMDVERKIRATLSNGEQLLISRQYADHIKEKLGVR